jgi:hypothetical protein
MAEEFKGLSNESLRNVQGVRDTMREVDLAVRDLNRKLSQTEQSLSEVKSEFSTISNSAKKFADLQDQASRSSKATTDSIKEQQKQLSIVRSLNVRIDELYRAASKVTNEAAFNLKRQAQNLADARDNARILATEYGKLAEDSSKLDRSTQFFSDLSEFTQDVRGLRTFSKPFQDAAEAARKQVLENAKNKIFLDEALKTGKGLTAEKIKELGLTKQAGGLTGTAAAARLKASKAVVKTESVGLAGLQAGFKALGPIISKSLGLLGLVKIAADAIKLFVEASFAADKRVTEIAKNLSIGKEASRGIYDNLTDLKGTLDTEFATTENLVKAFNEIATLTEFSAIASKAQLETQIVLTNQLGQSVEEAQALQGLFAVNNVEADKGLDIVYDQIAAFANQNKIVADGRQILKQIQGVSKLILLNFKGNTSELVKTVLQTNKLGLSLDQVNKIAGSLLDFEQSIEAELTAEFLTGKQLNLDKARQFALTNDIAGLTEEIKKSGVDQLFLNAKTRIEQEAIAAAYGMQANEMADMIYKSQVIDKVAGDTTKKLREQANLQEKKGNLQKADEIRRQAAAIEQGILDGKTLEQAQKSVDTQEKFNLALEKAKEIFTDVVDGGLLDGLVDALNNIVIYLETLGFGNREARLANEMQKAIETQKSQGKRLNKEKFAELQAAANTTPTMVMRSLGIEGAFKGDSFSSFGYVTKEEREAARAAIRGTINADDFTIRTHPKDELVIAGGTNLSGGSNQEMLGLMKQLISATEQNRQVTVSVNGEAVFSAMGRTPMK